VSEACERVTGMDGKIEAGEASEEASDGGACRYTSSCICQPTTAACGARIAPAKQRGLHEELVSAD
jgi:hypothetical protein